VSRRFVSQEQLKPERLVAYPNVDLGRFGWGQEKALGAEYLYEIEDVLVSPFSGVVWIPDGYILGESIGSLQKVLTFGNCLLDVIQKDGVQIDRRIIPCPVNWGYYHFFLEVLPRVITARQRFPDAQILIPSRAPGFVDEALGLLFDVESVLRLDEAVRVRSAVFASYSQFSGIPDNDDVSIVRAAFDFLRASSGTGRKLYVSRRNSARTLRNENEFERLFQEHDFEILLAEDYSLEKQIRIFSEASVVAGFHGAGVTNVLHAPPGCRVLELFRPDYVNSCFARLSSLLAHEHKLMECPVSEDSAPVPDGLERWLKGC
jgi:hypothetical protein